MLDTMTFTKLSAGFLSAWLILLLGKWAAEEIYHAELHGQASYSIAVEGADAEPEEVVEVDIVAMIAAADPADGEKVFRKCSSCHQVADGANATGPHLYAVVGRDIASIGGFGYSGALADAEGDWTPEALSAFLENPKGWAPGTTMGFAGLKKPEDRADLIAYLQSIGG